VTVGDGIMTFTTAILVIQAVASGAMCGNPGIVDRDQRARLLEFKPHCTVGMGHLTIDHRDFN
jgi:hypothetical protein